MKSKINFFGIITAILILISIFLPWLSGSMAGYEMETYSRGIEFDDLKITVIVALIGAFVAFFRIRWAVILIGILCFMQGLLHLGWYLFADKISSDYSGGAAGLNPSYGLILFLVASLLFIFSTKKVKKDVEHKSVA